MIRRASILVSILSVMGLVLSACGASQSTTSATKTRSEGSGAQSNKLQLTIGFSGALSGDYASYDVPFLNGMKFAAKIIDSNGGLNGVTVRVLSKDNAGDPSQTASTTQQLLGEGVRVFALTTAATSVEEGQLIAKAGGIASAGENTSPPIVGEVGTSAFMLAAGDNGAGAAAAEYACAKGYRRAYVIGSPGIPYTKLLPVYFTKSFKHYCNGQIVGTDTFTIGDSSYSAQVTKLQNAGGRPDVVYTPMFIPDFSVFMKELRSAGVTLPVITAGGNDSDVLLTSGGSAVNGVVLTTQGFPTRGSSMARFFKQYTDVMGQKPQSNQLEAVGRDNVYALVEAAARAHSTDPKQIYTQVMKFRNLPLVTGRLTMNPTTRIPIKQMSLITVRDGSFAFLEHMTPSWVPPAS